MTENPRHFIGKMCPRVGHGNKRFLSDGTCIVCARERVRARRAAARKADSTKRFLGVPCGRCGGTERYRVDHACVVCKLEQSAARQAAATKARKAAGTSRTFRGKPCQTCGRRLRFRATGKCVACDRVGYYARNAHRPRRTYPRRDALAEGKHTYVGKICPQGHDGGGGSVRYAISGCCKKCVQAMSQRRLTEEGRARIRERERARDRRKALALKTCLALGIPI